MRAQLLLLSLSLALTPIFACGDDGTPTDTGVADSGTDSSPTDTGTDTTPPVDSGADTSTPGCTADCEFVDVVGGATHSCALRANGTVWCWGGNISGTLGDGRIRHGGEPCGMMEGGDIPDCTGPVQVSVLDDATELSARSGLENCALRESGGTWCWGLQGIGPAAGGEAPRRFEPESRPGLEDLETISDGFSTTCGVVAGQAVCVGRNGSGQVGNGTNVDVRVPHTIAMPTGVDLVEAGASSDITCALASGAAWCWGANEDGQLGTGMLHAGGCEDGDGAAYDCSMVPVAVAMPTGITFTQIKPGGSHICALGSDSNAYCWGANQYGQLGTGDQVISNIPVQVTDTGDVAAVDTGANFTCLLRTAGTVTCFGDNQEGQVGDGTMDHGGDCGGAATGCCGPMATDCSWDIQQVTGLSDAIDIGVGWRHACAIRAAGETVCWGYNTKKQLGDGTRDRRSSPVVVMDLGD